MSLSDYISIFDTRPIAQSHLFEAATATLRAVYTGVHVDIYHTYERIRAADRCGTRTACVRRNRTARHGTARQARHTRPDQARPGQTRPGQARPRHATPHRFAGPILCCPRGPLTLMLTPTLPPLPLAASIVSARTRVYAYIPVVGSATAYETLNDAYVARYTCADLRDRWTKRYSPVQCQKLPSRPLSSSRGLKEVCWECPFKSRTISP